MASKVLEAVVFSARTTFSGASSSQGKTGRMPSLRGCRDRPGSGNVSLNLRVKDERCTETVLCASVTGGENRQVEGTSGNYARQLVSRGWKLDQLHETRQNKCVRKISLRCTRLSSGSKDFGSVGWIVPAQTVKWQGDSCMQPEWVEPYLSTSVQPYVRPKPHGPLSTSPRHLQQ
ncbi:hypothetical protein L1887_61801 [Cichorium endivia]|nr:hypothetical protein L1887_61801 [Cichorium endivia]